MNFLQGERGMDGHDTTGSKIHLHDHKQHDARVQSSGHSHAGPSLFLSELVRGQQEHWE